MWSAALAVTVAAIPAPVPPKDCGRIEPRSTTLQIKADKVRCKRARRYSRRYVVTRRAPDGWRVKRYPRSSAFAFRLRRGTRSVFAIRRS